MAATSVPRDARRRRRSLPAARGAGRCRGGGTEREVPRGLPDGNGGAGFGGNGGAAERGAARACGAEARTDALEAGAARARATNAVRARGRRVRMRIRACPGGCCRIAPRGAEHRPAGRSPRRRQPPRAAAAAAGPPVHAPSPFRIPPLHLHPPLPPQAPLCRRGRRGPVAPHAAAPLNVRAWARRPLEALTVFQPGPGAREEPRRGPPRPRAGACVATIARAAAMGCCRVIAFACVRCRTMRACTRARARARAHRRACGRAGGQVRAQGSAQ